ncbi:hypothetical protein EJ05DRAFT_501580 [Pseudovirgaria hyperparasitica]|uniref:Uncharacterized protein n=1 Tax=Pseudovirgaria hyperparasitica TaxID=470096 RepID=A0A6A6W656_9PEZI|nr:uncharacterized protein EJ05DRAFT_501580 [Pseudovirgaria hyperparasitica]KAF2757037.1 hypothetical protein EJ05DRAFT_501580 [Pseudovirgaria hyperparasitica]
MNTSRLQLTTRLARLAAPPRRSALSHSRLTPSWPPIATTTLTSRRCISEPAYQPPQPQQPHPPTPPKSNPHREFYYTFGSPVLKVFLGALFTYELLLFAWLKLENIELARDLKGQVAALEAQLAELTQRK